jgi:polar amino acid transport system permease protein
MTTAVQPGSSVATSAIPDVRTPLPEGIDGSRRVLRQSRPGQWVLTAVVIILALNFGQTLFSNPSWEWPRFAYWLFNPAVLSGLGLTLTVTALSAIASFLGGILIAVARLSNNVVLSAASWLYVWLFRSVPLILVLIFLYNLANLYPQIGVGVPFGPQLHLPTLNVLSDITLGVIGLSLSEVAYSGEVVRSGLLAVDQGQHEAAKALGMPRWRQFTRIVLPQALRTIVPSYVNQVIGLVKSSSLLFYVGLLDVFGVVQNLGSTFPTDIIPLLVVAAFWYLVVSSAISIVQFYVERHFARGALRVLPPTPLQRLRRAVASIPGGVR